MGTTRQQFRSGVYGEAFEGVRTPTRNQGHAVKDAR